MIKCTIKSFSGVKIKKEINLKKELENIYKDIKESWEFNLSTEKVSLELGIPERTIRNHILNMRELGILVRGYRYREEKYGDPGQNGRMYPLDMGPYIKKCKDLYNLDEQETADGVSYDSIQIKPNEEETKLENKYSTRKDYLNSYPKQIELNIVDGYMVVFSDVHPNPSLPITVAHKALLKVCQILQPKLKVVVCNGDGFDFAQISTHGRIGYSKVYSMKEELDFGRERLAEVKEAAGNCPVYYTIGNHDVLRYDTFLAKNAGQFSGVTGFKFQDQIDWPVCLQIVVNKDTASVPTLIKHRMGSTSLHSNYTNAHKSLINTVNGHNHKLRVASITDYFGKARYGVETGTLSDVHGNQFFDYCEGGQSNSNWESGFVVLAFDSKGDLLPPELVTVVDGRAYFRGSFLELE